MEIDVIIFVEYDGILCIPIKNLFLAPKYRLFLKNFKKREFFSYLPHSKAVNRFFSAVKYMKIDVIFFDKYNGVLYFVIKCDFRHSNGNFYWENWENCIFCVYYHLNLPQYMLILIIRMKYNVNLFRNWYFLLLYLKILFIHYSAKIITSIFSHPTSLKNRFSALVHRGKK